MICLICGQGIGREYPVRMAEITLCPSVPYIEGMTPNESGYTILKNRFICLGCYKKIKDNDQKIVEEASQMRGKNAL